MGIIPIILWKSCLYIIGTIHVTIMGIVPRYLCPCDGLMFKLVYYWAFFSLDSTQYETQIRKKSFVIDVNSQLV